MISAVYRKAGVVDWALVIQALSEIGAIEECGGRERLNEIFTDDYRYPDGRYNPEPFIREYASLLWDYSAQRTEDPSKPVLRYTDGKGRIEPNRRAKRDTDPSDVGEAWIQSVKYRIRGWRDGHGLNIKFYPEPR